METNRNNTAQFRIIGRIGSINKMEKVTHISIASDLRTKDVEGNWMAQTNWNSVTVLASKLRNRLSDPNVGRHGNLLAIEGSILSNAYEKDEEKVYSTSLVVQNFEVLSFARETK